MDLKPGDWVRTETGLQDRIMHLTRQTAFVEVEPQGGNQILPFLLSELIKIDTHCRVAGADLQCCEMRRS